MRGRAGPLAGPVPGFGLSEVPVCVVEFLRRGSRKYSRGAGLCHAETAARVELGCPEGMLFQRRSWLKETLDNGSGDMVDQGIAAADV